MSTLQQRRGQKGQSPVLINEPPLDLPQKGDFALIKKTLLDPPRKSRGGEGQHSMGAV